MICVPIVSPTMDHARKDLDACQKLADIIELRLDLIEDFDLPLLLKEAGKPCIVTNRCKIDGGQFAGTEAERVEILRQAIELHVDYIDIETSTPGPLLKSILENKGRVKVILSHHDFTRTPDDLNPLYDLMRQMPADVLKIVTYATDINDNLTLFRLLARARKDNKRMIAFCMGEKGEISRVLTVQQGGWLTFGSLETGKESAPGQITAGTLKHIYRVNDLKTETKVYGVIGDPVSKSMGYLIHNKAFQETGLPHVYVPLLVQNVTRFFNAYEPYLGGLSVTMPHKEAIMKTMDRLDPAAERIGAVNTVVHDGNGWTGFNTDYSGALKALEPYRPLQDKNILIIGAGGTAKAIGQGVADQGAQLTLTFNRNRDKAQELADQLKCKLISVRDMDQAAVDILINCSPVGMAPNTNDTPYPARLLKKDIVVFDSVYNPMETRLLKDAQAAGCATVSGVELFVHQAAGQFALWTGQPAPIDLMRRVVEDKLAPQD